MGNYIYALRSPTVSRYCEINNHGTIVTELVGQYKYVYKPGSYRDKFFESVIDRMIKIWKNVKIPTYYVHQFARKGKKSGLFVGNVYLLTK